jgi:hypothetical protein
MERIIAAGLLLATLLLAACAAVPNAAPQSSQPEKPPLPSGSGSVY